VRDEVFQVSELVEPYRVAPSVDLKENSNFHVFDDSLVDVDAKELNVVLSSSGHVTTRLFQAQNNSNFFFVLDTHRLSNRRTCSLHIINI
jgi:hypothetical protein